MLGFLLAVGLTGPAIAPGTFAAQAQVPAYDGWVTDLAGLLDDPEEHALESLMESYRVGATHEIALLTVPNLGGEPLERFALEVGRAWKLGGAGNNGALLLVAREERKVRIEVGRGLEGVLPDSICGRIIRNVISPQFKSGEFYAGIDSGLRALHAAAGGDYGPIERTQRGRESAGGHIALIFLFFVLLLVMSSRGGRGLRRRRGLGPWIGMPMRGGLGAGSLLSGGRGGFSGGGGFGGFGGGGGFSGGGASGGW